MIQNDLILGDDVCPLGALAISKGISPSELPLDCDGEEIAHWAVRSLGITWTLAWVIQEENDEFLAGRTPEERYDKMVKWLESWLTNGVKMFQEYKSSILP